MKVLQPLREYHGRAIKITSGYRSSELNKKVGGVKDSHHLAKGQFAACDIVAPGWPSWYLVDAIIYLNLPVVKAINEFDRWCHVSTQRPVYLNAYKNNVFTEYEYYGRKL